MVSQSIEEVLDSDISFANDKKVREEEKVEEPANIDPYRSSPRFANIEEISDEQIISEHGNAASQQIIEQIEEVKEEEEVKQQQSLQQEAEDPEP